MKKNCFYVFLLSAMNVVSCYGSQSPDQAMIPLEGQMKRASELLNILDQKSREAIEKSLANYHEQQKKCVIQLELQNNNIQKQLNALTDDVSGNAEKIKLLQEDYNRRDGDVTKLQESVVALSSRLERIERMLEQSKKDFSELKSNQPNQAKRQNNTPAEKLWIWEQNFSKIIALRILLGTFFYNKFGGCSVVYYGISEIGSSLSIKKFDTKEAPGGKLLSGVVIMWLSLVIAAYGSDHDYGSMWITGIIMPLCTGLFCAAVAT